MSKTVSFLGKANSGLVRLAGYILVPVQHHLGGEGRMSADLDGDMAPLGIEDMKGVVVHVGHGLLAFEVMGPGDVPYRGLGATHEDEKQPLGDLGLGQIFLGDVVLTFPHGAVDDRNIVRFRIAAKAATEATRHPHQMSVVQGVIGPSQGLPPYMKAPGRMSHTEVSIQNDPIDAIVAAGEKILIEVAESVCHRSEDYRHSQRRGNDISPCF